MTALDREAVHSADCDPAHERHAAAAARLEDRDALDSRTLFDGRRRRVIVHQGERYCLQLTRAGKLLLTK